MLDEYTDEFGTNLESKIPEFNQAQPQADMYQPRQTGVPFTNPQAQQYQLDPRYQQAQQSAYQPPIYQQYVYQPQPQQAYQTPAPSYRQPIAQDRINAVFGEESQELNNLLKAENNSGCLKNLLFVLICCVVVVGSFGLSYLVGAKIINQQNIAPSFSVTRGVKKIKNMMDSSDLIKDEKAFTHYTVPATRNVVLPPEVQYTPPPPAPSRPQTTTAPKPVQTAGTTYRVIVGDYSTKQEAADVAANVRADGFPVYQYTADGKYRLQIGAFKSKALATALMKKAGEYGYNAYLSIK